jgi:hypothetical protein
MVATTTCEGATGAGGAGFAGPAAEAEVGRTTTFPPPQASRYNVDAESRTTLSFLTGLILFSLYLGESQSSRHPAILPFV